MTYYLTVLPDKILCNNTLRFGGMFGQMSLSDRVQQFCIPLSLQSAPFLASASDVLGILGVSF